jgi:hypothetical protein
MGDEDLAMIRALREQIESRLRQGLGSTPRIYYGGSYAKGTMIREAFDLDIIVYYPHTENATLGQLFDRTQAALAWGRLYRSTKDGCAAPSVPTGVPRRRRARASSGCASFFYATLYKNG